MKWFAKSVLIAISLVNGAVAQQPIPRQPADLPWMFRDPEWRELLNQSAERVAAAARRQDEQDGQRQFVQDAEQFINLWNQFANEYNQKKAFNIKLAKELSKAFRRLEKTTTWPGVNKGK